MVPTTTKKRKTSQKVAKSDVDDVSVSPAVRRTRGGQVTKQVTCTGHCMNTLYFLYLRGFNYVIFICVFRRL